MRLTLNHNSFSRHSGQSASADPESSRLCLPRRSSSERRRVIPGRQIVPFLTLPPPTWHGVASCEDGLRGEDRGGGDWKDPESSRTCIPPRRSNNLSPRHRFTRNPVKFPSSPILTYVSVLVRHNSKSEVGNRSKNHSEEGTRPHRGISSCSGSKW
jgi:hypothetical protein